MEEKNRIIGIDAGSVTVSVVVMDLKGSILDTKYKYHHGKPALVLRDLLLELDYSSVAGVARTASAPDIFEGAVGFDTSVSVIQGVKFFYKDFKSILNVGGEKFVLIEFDDNGNYLNIKSNTSCAAGTGGFLDQQAKRLNLEDSAALSEKAIANTGDIPKIASRCSVFAKTDIIHCQQEGFSLEEICDGLSLGLARNIADTLISGDSDNSPMIFAGGVAKNKSVINHLEQVIGYKPQVHQYSHLFGAIGTIQLLLEEKIAKGISFSADSIIADSNLKKDYFYEPLELKLSEYPDFDGLEHYEYLLSDNISNVEVDIYQELKPTACIDVYIGIDIGSTSTKAIVIDRDFIPVAGFYTRTSGRPIVAVQAIFEACFSYIKNKKLSFNFVSVGSTGSGRKFIGKLIGADTILDEISAHARAAVNLDPDIDTIIEIGGQDAKFTTLRKGVVTFSQMNTVCAAGTGSFIEEQALKLGVSLSDYASLAEGARAPLASNRCTVFMERDINHYLNKNYRVDEILAAVLYSVRENYLQKVATEGNIGNRVFFQGATARNKALVAAFEQKLKKPIFVSKYCHLTGALGAAITAAEEQIGPSTFKGLEIYNETIPVRSETCDLCLNNCRIRVASVKDEEVAYGFLCGRDYETKKFVKKAKVPSLLKVRRKILEPLGLDEINDSELPVIGIPGGLQIYEEIPLWQKFFHNLGISTVTSEYLPDVISNGKKLAGAEFCSPMAAFYGHIDGLVDKSDIIFLPIHIENKKDEKNSARLRKFCYYTQFSSTLVSRIKHKGTEIKSMMPLVNHRATQLKTKYELLKALNKYIRGKYNFLDISRAYDDAINYYRETKDRLKKLYKTPGKGEVKVLLAGRPYTVLLESMNKDIPDFFATLGIETVFTDSLPDVEPSESVDKLLDQFHWSYPSAILAATDFCARTEGLYPVFVTSFKCSPDSFTLEYFKRIMDEHEKPYLILQIDDHDSNVGYETRIEAGIRAFRNHLKSADTVIDKKEKLPVLPVIEKSLKNKTVLLPNWDSFVLPLVAANLQNIGVDARVLEETSQLISSSMKMNTGQCIPVNAVAHEYVEYIRKYNLKPKDTVLWMIKSGWACNITMYPAFIKSLIEKEGLDMSKAGVYSGELTMVEISPIVSIKTYFAYMFGGNLKKIGCMIRPYESVKGETDRVILESRDIFESAFLGKISFVDAVKQVIVKLDRIKYIKTNKPKVAIFGDLYVRDNDIMNQGLIRYIEDAGGEVLVTPYNDYAKIISGALFKRWIKELRISEVVLFKSLLAAMELLEGRYHGYLGKYIGKQISSKNPMAEKELAEFNIRIEQEGETYENILKIFRIMKEHPNVSLFVQTNPAFCCPSLITEAMSKEIETLTGVPVLSISYDGTESQKNDVIIPYLKFANNEKTSVGAKEAISAV
jgi:predicted CoA-substrate-specific enzyme activase